MSVGLINPAVRLLVVGYVCFQSAAAPSQNSSPVEPPATLKEFQDNGSLYFPKGSFKKATDGSPDDHYGDSIAWYLRIIGEPSLATSASNSRADSFRLILIGFPSGKTVILRLRIENNGTAKIFVKQTPVDGANFLLNNENSVEIAAVNGFPHVGAEIFHDFADKLVEFIRAKSRCPQAVFSIPKDG